MAFAIPNSLSPSKISSFTDCPLYFRFSILERLPEPPSPSASKGTLVHRALELLMLRPAAERTGEAVMADLERAGAELAGRDDFTGLRLSPAESEAFVSDAARLLRHYLDLEDPVQVQPIGLELRLSASLAGYVSWGSSTASRSTRRVSWWSPTTRPARCPVSTTSRAG